MSVSKSKHIISQLLQVEVLSKSVRYALRRLSCFVHRFPASTTYYETSYLEVDLPKLVLESIGTHDTHRHIGVHMCVHFLKCSFSFIFFQFV